MTLPILMYHRVAALALDPWGLAVDPSRFEEQIEILSRAAMPLPLSHAVRALADQTLPPNAVVVTFDDGYADNLTTATPVLERHGVPATFFICSGQIGSGQAFWWDTLTRILLGPALLPPVLGIPDAGTASHVRGRAAEYSADERAADREHVQSGRGSASPRLEFYRSVHRRLQPMRPSPRAAEIDALARWAGVDHGAVCAAGADRALDEAEVARLAANPLYEIGGHTVTHPLLTTIPPAEQREEIAGASRALASLAGHPISSLAYPYGNHNDTTCAIVRDLGLSAACTTERRGVRPPIDITRLPRLAVGDWDGETFARMMARVRA